MLLRDENLPEGQRVLLRKARSRFRAGNHLFWLICFLATYSARKQPALASSQIGLTSPDQNLAAYFRSETTALSRRCLADIHSLDDWQAHRAEYRRQLQEMLGLWPMPERTDLRPVVTGKIERADFTVEKLHFQALPHLYVTANLYLPRKLQQPLPAILYVCGHSQVVTNGVSCGNKTYYQHHGEWFARNGYVCLVIDTLQLGEIEGLHHGTYREGQWWWNSRGYTPAGVEAWFGIRALDYLCSRPEVDKDRIGMTGRSGGGSYTWTVAALDERVKVAAPVAGITDLQNQVVDGAVEGHCDCMFFVNTHRWDFPQVAALIAPRPLLIANSDKDTIFPLDGVVRVYNQARRIYQLHSATNHLGLLITDGPHADTQDLQLPVFRWFNRFLKQQDPLIEMAAKKYFEPQELRVFDQLPADQINTRIQESFVPAANRTTTGIDRKGLQDLRAKAFGGWPAEPCPVVPVLYAQSNHAGLHIRCYRFTTQPGVELPFVLLSDAKVRKPPKVILKILDTESWTNSPCETFLQGTIAADQIAGFRRQMQDEKAALAFVAPRLVEPSSWACDPKKFIQIRRRFMLLGQTLDGMRVWDICCAVQLLHSLSETKTAPVYLLARGDMGVNAAYAALFEPGVARLRLVQLPASQLAGPDYLNVLKFVDLPQVITALGNRLQLN
jgi:dienelactone hydrolase